MNPFDPDYDKKNTSFDRFWNALTALLYLGVLILSALGSFTILPVFGYSGLALIGMTGLVTIIMFALFWIFTKIWSVFSDF